MMPAFPDLPLRTERLLLRPFQPTDAQALFDIFSDPLVMRYWSSPPWTSIEQAHAAIERDTRSLASGDHLRLALVGLADGRLLGQCTLFSISPQCRRAEIGYGMAASAWGHGYMHEALRALVAYGFETLGLNRIEADIDPRNTASASSLERLGFSKEGYLRERWIVNDEVSDSAIYGLLRKDWSAGA